MTYQVELSKKADKQLSALPEVVQQRIRPKIQALADEPRPSGVTKLKGKTDDIYRIRVGDYRVVYQIQDQKLLVFVVEIDHRSDIYRKK